MRIIKAPGKLDFAGPSIFLAGSIEMGQADNWQEKIEKDLAGKNITILDPRRDRWNSKWKQNISNPEFKKQVEWELEAMEKADYIFMYFDADTKSPVSLLELGLFAKSGKLIVCCQEGFWRKRNVDIVCKKYGVKQIKEPCSDFLKKLF